MEDNERLARIVIGCSFTAALEAMGERWSFLILRGAFNGLNHFEQFQSTLGIARNILANRLARLVEHDILERCPCADDRRKVAYRLTDKGQALLPTLVAMRQWGERWGAGTCSSRLIDARDGAPLAEVVVHAADGRVIRTMDEMRWDVSDDGAGDVPPPFPLRLVGA